MTKPRVGSLESLRVAAWVTAMAWAIGAGCSPMDTVSGTGGQGAGAAEPEVDYEGSTGAGDDELNEDLDEEEDTEDPSQPECGPESIIDESGNCIPSCFESGNWCADGGEPTECDGYAPVESYDCTTCCAIPEDEQDCPPEGCTDEVDDEDCPPDEDCAYTEACPDTVCGDDEDCDSCPIDCGACPATCGDGICSDGFESCGDCPDDCECPASCGDGLCSLGEAPDGETCENCADDCGRCVKVMTWDINAGLKKGKSNVKKTLKSIANLIALEKPDYVGLQSVDKNTKRSGEIDQALFIAKRTKMYKRFGGAFKYNGGQYGVAFLSKHPILGMAKTKMPTSNEWAKRRVLLTASLELDDFYVFFHMGVTQLARAATPRLAQATTIANDLGFEADALLVGDMFEVPDGDAVQKLQENGSMIDLWPDYSNGGLGLTTAKKRVDYVMAAYNWWNPVGEGSCAFVVRTYVKPAKGLASHRPVIAVLQRGLGGADCGNGDAGDSYDGYDGDYEEDDIGFGFDECTTDGDCAGDPIYSYCVESYCSECKTDAECTDPEYPTCNEAYECN
jgi:endonuclease/exonuclease/phosphatase family metal-dependent hydrolase